MKKTVHQYILPKKIEGFYVLTYGILGAILSFIIGNKIIKSLGLSINILYIVAGSILMGMIISYLWDITAGKINRVILGIDGLRVYKDDEFISSYKLSDIVGPKVSPIFGGRLPMSFSKGLRVVTAKGNITTLRLGLLKMNDFVQLNEDITVLLKRVNFLEAESTDEQDENFFQTVEFVIPRKDYLRAAREHWEKKAGYVLTIGLILFICLMGSFVFIPNVTPGLFLLSVLCYICVFCAVVYFVTAHDYMIYRNTLNYTPMKIRFNNNGIVAKRASVDVDLIKSVSITSDKLTTTKRYMKNYRWLTVDTNTRVVRYMFGPKLPGEGEEDTSYANYSELVNCVRKWAEIKNIQFKETKGD